MLFRSPILYFPGFFLPAQSGCPARNAHSVSRFSRALLRSGFYLTAEQLAAKYMLTHYRSSIVSCAPTRPCGDHVFRFLGALLSSRRFPGNSILSCCSYSVVGAYRLLLGRAKARWFRERGFPGSVFPIQSRGDSVRRDRRIGSQPQGDGAGLSANPLPRGSHPLFL